MGFNKKNKSKPTSILIWGAVILFFMLANADTDAEVGLYAVLLLIVAAGYIVIKLGKKIQLKPKEDKVCSGEDVGLSHQHQQKSYTPQEIQDRDEQRRMEQLNSFLKNGLIDKKEYLVLKARYEEKQ
jgi:hypothetical protein